MSFSTATLSMIYGNLFSLAHSARENSSLQPPHKGLLCFIRGASILMCMDSGREIARICAFCIESLGFLTRNSLQRHQHKSNTEESRMKSRIAVITILCIGLVFSVSILSNQTYAQGKRAASANGPVVMPKITVLNPMGTPPPITLVPQAPRQDTLDGKTIYFINTGFIGTDRFMDEMAKWFKVNYPKTNIVIKMSGTGVSAVSKALWTEIAEKGDAAIVGLGH
jgi:hypothetical protein